MIRITVIRRFGRQCYRAVLVVENRVYLETVLPTELAARAWVRDELARLTRSAA